MPQHYGPTWERNPDWDGETLSQEFNLPTWTLGWQVIRWIEDNLLSDDLDDNDKPLPFQLTNEQMRFILWFYAINEFGHFAFREIVLQRLKGWG